MNRVGVTGTYALTALEATEGFIWEPLETAPTSDVNDGDNNVPRTTKAAQMETNGPLKKPELKFVKLWCFRLFIHSAIPNLNYKPNPRLRVSRGTVGRCVDGFSKEK
jgi:hypothetical protein